jgi:hypothetical protein
MFWGFSTAVLRVALFVEKDREPADFSLPAMKNTRLGVERKVTFAQRLIRAAHGRRLQSTKPFTLVEELFAEIHRKEPATAPDAVFTSLGGLIKSPLPSLSKAIVLASSLILANFPLIQPPISKMFLLN